MKPNTRHPVRASRISFDLRDPPTHDRAVEEIAKAVTVVQGNVVHAAAILEVSHRQLARWIASYPTLKDRVDQIRMRFGHTHGIPSEDQEDPDH
jgi:hypothetical protein